MHYPSILVINPGSTNTKLAVFKGPRRRQEWTREHLEKAGDELVSMTELAGLRAASIKDDLREKGYRCPEDFDLIVARGGLLKPLQGGVYRVNRDMVEDLARCAYGRHQSNLGAIIAWEMIRDWKKEAYVVNPVVVDEMWPVAKVSGHPSIVRRSIFHALSQKAVAVKAASRLGKPYGKARLIVVHAGGGVSIGAHLNGKVVDVNNALEGEGAFTPERSGGLPLIDFLRYVKEKNLGFEETYHLITRQSGLLAYLGTQNCREVEQRIRSGDTKARQIYQAFIYQIAKEIGALAAAVFCGKLDGIVMTGGIAGGSYFRRGIKKHVGYLARVFAYPQTSEMEALAVGGWEVWNGSIRARTYR